MNEFASQLVALDDQDMAAIVGGVYEMDAASDDGGDYYWEEDPGTGEKRLVARMSTGTGSPVYRGYGYPP